MGSFLPPETTEEYYLLVLEEFLSRHGEHEQKRARSKCPFLLMHANTHILLHTHTPSEYYAYISLPVFSLRIELP